VSVALGSAGLRGALAGVDAPPPDGDEEQASIISAKKGVRSIFQTVFIAANNTLNRLDEN